MTIYKKAETKDSNGNTVVEYKRKEELSFDDAKKTFDAFSLIGFYDTKTSAMAQGSVAVQKGLNAIKGFIGG
ncbi:MAG: hypothetical protein RR229_05470 [Oscillospiraceae bacterium]